MQKTCIIVPCYNEQYRLPVSDFKAFIPESGLYFCFVNDGSSDNTVKILQDLQETCKDRILIVDNTQNKGKAEAVRSGINAALEWQNFDLLGYMDADLATPLTEMPKLISTYLNASNVWFVLGSRVSLLGKKINRSRKRHYLGRVFSTFSSIILGLPVYDTQCGAKIIKADIAKQIFKDPFITSWLFDIELIARTKQLVENGNAESYFIEFPLDYWSEIEGSKIKLKHLIMVPYQLFSIYRKYS